MELVDILVALINDNLSEAIKLMFDYDSNQNNNRLQNQIIHQSGRFHANEKSKNIGTISSENYNRTRNQLRYALQELVKDFPGYGADVQKQAMGKIAMSTSSGSTSNTNTVNPIEQTFKILMLTSNPKDTGKLQLEKEHSRISSQIQNSQKDNDFPIRFRQAVTLANFSEALLDEKPGIVHFSGHGEMSIAAIKQAGNSRGQGFDEETSVSDSTGIILTSDDGRESHFIGTSVIRRLFKSMTGRHKIPIQAVVFNSCYSEAQAQAIADIIPNVIGTTSAIKDEAAIAFANGFYSFLTRTKDIESAWDNGVTQAMAYGEPEERFIYFKNGEKVK